jgi:hypothetical protein
MATTPSHDSVLPLARRSGGDPAHVELGDQLGIVEHIDRYGAVANHREREHRERPLAVERDRAGGAVDERGTNVRRETSSGHRSAGDPTGPPGRHPAGADRLESGLTERAVCRHRRRSASTTRVYP